MYSGQFGRISKQSICPLQRRIVHCARRPPGGFHAAHRFRKGKEMAYVLWVGDVARVVIAIAQGKRTDLFYSPKIMYLAGCAG